MNTQTQQDSNNSSLSMFFAAIGGAVLGMLATLLVLALINGGTLNFIQPDRSTLANHEWRIIALEEKLNAVDGNLGNVVSNMEVLAAELNKLRAE